jgi:hypothetical protein
MTFRDKAIAAIVWTIATILVHEMSQSSWALSFVIGSAFSYIWILQYKLDLLTSSFELADAELVRVSALANQLESQLADLTIKAEAASIHSFSE